MTLEAHNTMINTAIMQQEAKYIHEMLEACSAGSLKIKTYTVVREDNFDILKERIDELVNMNINFELAAKPLVSNYLTGDKWVAILVEYENI